MQVKFAFRFAYRVIALFVIKINVAMPSLQAAVGISLPIQGSCPAAIKS